jgi:hypothetical protein
MFSLWTLIKSGFNQSGAPVLFICVTSAPGLFAREAIELEIDQEQAFVYTQLPFLYHEVFR